MVAAIATDRLLSRSEAAQLLGVTPHTLAVWASSGRYQLPYVKVGRAAKYNLADLQAFIAANTVTSTSEAQHG